MVPEYDLDTEIAELERRLADLDCKRAEIIAALSRLNEQRNAKATSTPLLEEVVDASVTRASSNAAKVALFLSLFHGRDDVFPRRWENPKSGKVGYSPVCRNEWIRGI